MAESSDLAVYVKGVYKQYGKGKKANHVLKGLDMEVSRNIMLVSVQIYTNTILYYMITLTILLNTVVNAAAMH